MCLAEPCPSEVFQRHIAFTLRQDEASATKLLDSLLNQCNWAFSEFIGMLQEVREQINRNAVPRLCGWCTLHRSLYHRGLWNCRISQVAFHEVAFVFLSIHLFLWICGSLVSCFCSDALPILHCQPPLFVLKLIRPLMHVFRCLPSCIYTHVQSTSDHLPHRHWVITEQFMSHAASVHSYPHHCHLHR